MSDISSQKLPYIGKYISQEHLLLINNGLEKNELLLGAYLFEKKHILVLTSKYFINWNRSPLIGRYNRTEYKKLKAIEKCLEEL